jgi:phospholipase/carboxylesterase
MDELSDLQIGDWTLKLRVPQGEGPHPVIFLVHGWTGDERSMWVFAPRLPKNALLIAPRAPYISKHPDLLGGYSWVQEHDPDWDKLGDFAPAVRAFNELIVELAKQVPGDFSQFGIAGFSQGAAMSFAYSLQQSERVQRLASLAGFLPAESGDALPALKGKPIFIAHGTKDESVPISMAHAAREQLVAVGAKVKCCEGEVGHKLAANCARELEEFFKAS